MQTAISCQRKITNSLRKIIANSSGSIRAYVAQEALDYDEHNPAQMFTDLMQCGCQSGLIGSLIYYADTHAFFDKYYDEIEELREEFEDNYGDVLKIQGDLKNWLAWYAFEEAAYRIAHEDLELEI